jgi:hypothetical protein
VREVRLKTCPSWFCSHQLVWVCPWRLSAYNISYCQLPHLVEHHCSFAIDLVLLPLDLFFQLCIFFLHFPKLAGEVVLSKGSGRTVREVRVVGSASRTLLAMTRHCIPKFYIWKDYQKCRFILNHVDNQCIHHYESVTTVLAYI